MPAISGPIAEVFGSDPVQFVLAVVDEAHGHFVDLVNRCSRRTGSMSWTAGPSGGEVTIPLTASRSNTVHLTALSTVAWALKNPPIFLDEATRIGMGLPMGIEGRADKNAAGDPYGYAATTVGGAVGSGIAATGGGIIVSGMTVGQLVATLGSLAAIVTAVAPIITQVASSVLPALLEINKAALGGGKPASEPADSKPKPKSDDGTLPLLAGLGVGAYLLFGRG